MMVKEDSRQIFSTIQQFLLVGGSIQKHYNLFNGISIFWNKAGKMIPPDHWLKVVLRMI